MDERILIIDDDRDMVEIFKFSLENEGYRVLVAYDGKAGFETAVAETPDLIMLDVMMKTMTEGIHVARQLHQDERTRGIPILMLSALRDIMKMGEELKPDEATLPIRRFLEKPVSPQHLLSEIRKLLTMPEADDPGEILSE